MQVDIYGECNAFMRYFNDESIMRLSHLPASYITAAFIVAIVLENLRAMNRNDLFPSI